MAFRDDWIQVRGDVRFSQSSETEFATKSTRKKLVFQTLDWILVKVRIQWPEKAKQDHFSWLLSTGELGNDSQLK
jgi:hypothetical protein